MSEKTYLKKRKELDPKKWDEFLELIRRNRIERKKFLEKL